MKMPGPQLAKRDWTVRSVSIDVARRLVVNFHYAAGAANTATYLHGLFRDGDIFDGQCLGVAWRGGSRQPSPPRRPRIRIAGKAS